MKWLETFLFHPSSPHNLAICRICFYGWLFLITLSYQPTDFIGFPEFMWQPIWIFYFFPSPTNSETILVLSWVWKLSLLMSCLGLFTRFSTVSAFVLGIYLLGLPNNYGNTFRYMTMPCLAAGIMACSRCGDYLSLDRMLCSSYKVPAKCWNYTWPIRLGQILFALMMCSAGLQKLLGVWLISGGNVVQYVFIEYYYLGPYKGIELSRWGLYLSQYQWLCWGLSFAVLISEFFAPLALKENPKILRIVIIGTLFGMQFFNACFLGIHKSFPWLPMYLFWVNWNAVLYSQKAFDKN